MMTRSMRSGYMAATVAPNELPYENPTSAISLTQISKCLTGHQHQQLHTPIPQQAIFAQCIDHTH